MNCGRSEYYTWAILKIDPTAGATILDCQILENLKKCSTHIGYKFQSVSVQVKNIVVADKIQCRLIRHTGTAVLVGGVNVCNELDLSRALIDFASQLLIGADFHKAIRRARRHGGDGHHCQQHHKHQQDADDATSCVLFCHT